MKNGKTILLVDHRIFLLRGIRVMLDLDLADLYGVTTKRLNEQVKRNRDRFPSDFMFQLNDKETSELVANCDRFNRLKHSSSNPHAFSEYGAIMLANILKSPTAIQASIQVVRAFARLRDLLNSHKDLAQKLASLERKYDSQFKMVFDAIRELMQPIKPNAITKVTGFVSGK